MAKQTYLRGWNKHFSRLRQHFSWLKINPGDGIMEDSFSKLPAEPEREHCSTIPPLGRRSGKIQPCGWAINICSPSVDGSQGTNCIASEHSEKETLRNPQILQPSPGNPIQWRQTITLRSQQSATKKPYSVFTPVWLIWATFSQMGLQHDAVWLSLTLVWLSLT